MKDHRENAAVPPAAVTRKLFALFKSGERDFEALRAAVITFSNRDASEANGGVGR